MNILRIYFSSQWRDSTSLCDWAVCNDAHEMVQQGQSVLSAMPKADACLGILAADKVSILSVPHPPGNKRRWYAALPFIAEEHCLSDPEELHVVPVQGQTANEIGLLVVDKAWLQQIISASHAVGLSLSKVVAETLLPPLQPNAWTLVWDGIAGFMRTSATTGLALSSDTSTTPPLGLNLRLQEAGENLPRKVEFLARGSASPMVLPAWPVAVPMVIGANWSWQQAHIPQDAPNLLWGDFTPPLRIFDWLPKLRPALFILLAAFFIEVIGSHLEWAILAQEKRDLTQKMTRIFRGAFGDNSTLVNPTLQMQRNLSSLRHATGVRDDADFLSLLDLSANALGDLGRTKLQSLNYDAGKLELSLRLTDKKELSAIEQKLRHAGLKVRSSEITDLADGTQAKLALSMEGV